MADAQMNRTTYPGLTAQLHRTHAQSNEIAYVEERHAAGHEQPAASTHKTLLKPRAPLDCVHGSRGKSDTLTLLRWHYSHVLDQSLSSRRVTQAINTALRKAARLTVATRTQGGCLVATMANYYTTPYVRGSGPDAVY